MPIEFAPPPSPNLQGFQIPAAQYEDPLATLAKLGAIRSQNLERQNAAMQLQKGQMALQQGQMELDSNKALLGAMVQGGGDFDKTYQIASQSGQVMPTHLFALKQHQNELLKEAQGLEEGKQTILAKDTDRYRGLLDNAKDQASLDAANATADKMGIGANVPRMRQFTDPDHITAFSNSLAMHSQIIKEEMDRATREKEAALTKKTGLETEDLLKTDLGRELRGLPKDPATGTTTPAAWVTVLRNPKYKDLNLPEVPTKEYVTGLEEYGIPEKDLPEYRIKARQAEAMASMKPVDWDRYVDSVIPPTGDTSALNARTKALVRGSIAAGDPLTAVRSIVKDASDQIGRTETGVRTAKATLPVKVEVAREGAGARAEERVTPMLVPNGSGGYNLQNFKAGDPVPAGAITTTQLGTTNVPTANTRAMAEKAPRVIQFVDRINQLLDENEKELGPLKGRWTEFTAGKVGLKDKGYSKLRTDMGLLTTALMNMHVGARGGGQMMEHFTNLINLAGQDPDNLRAALGEIKQYAQTVQGEAQPRGNEAAGGNASKYPALPAKLSQSDVGKIYVSPRTNKPMKITAVNPKDPTQFKSDEVQ